MIVVVVVRAVDVLGASIRGLLEEEEEEDSRGLLSDLGDLREDEEGPSKRGLLSEDLK